MCLIQAQAIFLTLFATLMTFAMETLRQGIEHHPPVENFVFLGSNSLIAMNIASAATGTIMVIVVIVSLRFALDPDNIATPIASSLGDLFTIVIMIGIAEIYFPFSSLSIWVPLTVTAIFCALSPVAVFIASKDEQAWVAARQQGPTFLLAAVLSSGAGVVQAFGATMFPELTVYQPLIAANSGNRAGLQSARISSYLNTYTGPNRRRMRLNPWKYYTSNDIESRAAFILLISCPAYQIIFVFTAHLIAYIGLSPLKLNILFLVGYLCTYFFQTFILVYLAEILVYSLFRYGLDPDMHAIPLLTSIGDLMGTSLLFLLFYLMSFIRDTVVVSSMTSGEMAENATSTCAYE